MPSRRKPPIGTRLRRSAILPIALGVALGAAVASDPPRSFGERIGPLRPGPGRLVGIPYAPEGAPLSKAQRVALIAEIQRLSPQGRADEGPDRRTPEALRQRAVLALVQKNPAGAIQLLERALENLPASPTPPQEAILRSDLSAAHLQRFVQGDSPISSLAALDEAARVAFRGFSGVRFNHALALERLYLGRQAKKVWQDLAAARMEPGWAAEAARHIGTLDAAQIGSQADIDRLLARIGHGDRQAAQELVRKEPQRARELATRDALWDWADSMGRGEAAVAEKNLAVVELLSGPLADHGDRVALDTITRLRAASPEKIQTAARGLRAYKEGFRLYRRFDHEQGIATLEAAGRDLAVLKLPQELEVELYRAYLENNAGRPGSRERVASVAARSAGRSYPGVEALVSWFEALIDGREGRPYDQAEAYRRTRAIYARLGEVENQSSVEGLLAEALMKLGRRDEALEGYLAAAAIAPRVQDPYRRRLIWSLLAFYLRREGSLGAGLAFQGEMLTAAGEQDDPTSETEPLLLGATLRAALGDIEGALNDLTTASSLVSSEPDSEDSNRIIADLARTEAEITDNGEIEESAPSLDQAISLYAKVQQGIFEMTARASRARLRADRGDLEGAEEDLGAIISFARRGGDWLSDAGDEDRYAFGREAKGAFAAMVRFQIVEARKPWVAFNYQEISRELLAPSSSGASIFLSRLDKSNIEALQAALPTDVALLEFGVMNDRIVSWLVMSTGYATSEHQVDAEQLTRLIARLDLKGELSQEAWKEVSARLFDLLIRPLSDHLIPGRTLVVVPDENLVGIPWSGLWDRVRKRYMVEDRAVVVNPSSNFYIKALARSRQLSPLSPKSRILAVGDPAFDSKEWQRFQRLPKAREDAVVIGSIFSRTSVILSGSRATWGAFSKYAHEADVIHLGMHAVLDSPDPFRSFLLFADSGVKGGRTLSEFSKLHPVRSSLAFLAVCEGAGGGGASPDISRAFLEAGIPVVVAPIGAVQDAKASRLTKAFFLALSKGKNHLDSMRAAQLRELGLSSRTEGYAEWANYLTFGST